jgi:hypothetical protein
MRGNSGVRGDRWVTGAGLASAGLVGAGVCATAALWAIPAGAATLAARSPTASAASGENTVPVIIFLKSLRAREGGTTVRSDQRFAVMRGAQASYRERLGQLGATDVHGYQLVNAMSARVPAASEARIADSRGVAAVIPDSLIAGPSPSVATGAGPAGVASAGTASAGTASAGTASAGGAAARAARARRPRRNSRRTGCRSPTPTRRRRAR